MTEMSEHETNHAERIGKLETAFSGLAIAVDKLQQGQERIERAISDSGKTNWSLIISALGVLLSFALVMWGAAIHPLTQDIDRQAKGADRLADAVIAQNDKMFSSQSAQDFKINDLITTMTRMTDRQEDMATRLKRFDEQGSAAADKRLLLLEYQMNHASPPIQTKTGNTP